MSHLQASRQNRPFVVRRRQRQIGFTLVELLVVVAIIVLLLATIIASLRAAREQSRRAKCSSNLRQLAIAWNDYQNDNKGAFLRDNLNLPAPNGRNYQTNFGGQQGLAVEYRIPKPLNDPYLHLPVLAGRVSGVGQNAVRVPEPGTAVFQCPSDDGYEYVRPSNYEYHGNSYFANRFLIGPLGIAQDENDPLRAFWPRLEQALPDLNEASLTVPPAQLILFGDFGWWSRMTMTTLRVEWHASHSSYNLAYFDGHVAFTKITKGLHVTARYTTIPIQLFANDAAELQQEVPDVEE